MPRYSSRYASSFSFGPGPVSTAIKALIGSNVVMFLAQMFAPSLTEMLGLVPHEVFGQLRIWQFGSYMFLYGGLFHILFNMLALWMFGTELERVWGTRYFLKFYFVTGIGAAILTVLFSLLPFAFAEQLQHSVVIGASGAIYGLLLAYALYYPDRPIYMYLVFPIPAKYFVLIMGAIALYSSMGEAVAGAKSEHRRWLLSLIFFMKIPPASPILALELPELESKMNRVRTKIA